MVTVFNRPQVTQQLFDELARIKPTRLYVACDGPTPDADSRELVSSVREVVAGAITWDCELYTHFQESNLGCRGGMVAAIDWFFSHVSEGIILEDDCLPSRSFFDLAAAFLDNYRTDSDVWGMTGDNSARIRIGGSETVGFSRYALIWGWATWADRWAKYDRNLETYSRQQSTGTGWSNLFEKAVFRSALDSILEAGIPDTWDVQWAWTVMHHHGVWGIPSQNLVTNIGFGEDASHTHTPTRRALAKRHEIAQPFTFPENPRESKLVNTQVLVKVHDAHRVALDRLIGPLRSWLETRETGRKLTS